MKIKQGFSSLSKIILHLTKYYYPIIIVVIFFIVKTHLFNIWIGLGTEYFKIRTLSALGLILILSSPMLLFRKRKIFLYSYILSSLTSIIFLSQIIYNSYVGGILSFSAIKYGGQLGSVSNVIFILLLSSWWKILIIFSDLIILILIKLFIDKRLKIEDIKYRIKIFTFLVVIVVGTLSYLFLFLVKERSFKMFVIPTNSIFAIQRMGVVNYFAQDTFKYFLMNKKPSKDEIAFAEEWKKNRTVDYSPNKYTGVAKGKNVIFVQLESFQDFLINLKIEGQEITPNFNKFARENYRNSNFYYQAGPGTTSDAEFSSLCSILPLSDQAVYFDYTQNDYPGIIKTLDRNGYNTSIMHGDVNYYWNRNVMYKSLELGNYFDISSFTINKPVGWGLSDKEFFDQSTSLLEKVKQPFFSMLISLTSHTPYEIPEDERDIKITEGNYHYMVDNYLYSANYVDKAFGELIERLKEEGLYDNSVIVIYGDHSAGIETYMKTNFEKDIQEEDINSPYEILYSHRVPFIIHSPGNKVTGLSDIPASQLDISPTILNMLGIEIPKDMLGRDIFSNNEPLTVLRRNTAIEGTVLNEKYLYAASTDQVLENGKCYNYKDKKIVPTDECKDIYKKSNDLLKVNDIVIRGNLFNLLRE